ncbi:MAG: hypothetical protein JW748_03935 [Anaerolineales bacterium]|nr:hypothetical protein [Anaerolineales bacterium]
MMQAIPLFLAFLAILCFPSANLQIFDGLPISRLPEFAMLVLAAPFLLFRELRVRQADFWKRWKIRPAWLWIFLAVIFVFKIALFASGEHSGFAGCYRSGAEPTAITHEELPYRECERSYENLFVRYSATRLDETIWFGPDGWNLVFLNTNRYNYYEWEPGNIPRPRIPITARWSGYPDIAPGIPIRIEYAGEGTVTWGDVSVVLPPAYAETAVVDINPPPANSPLAIEYSFDDGSRSGQDEDAWGPRASIKVSAAENGIVVPLPARSAALWRILALLTDGMILLWIVACLPSLWHSIRRDLAGLIAFSAGIVVFSFLPAAPVVRGIGLTIVLAAILAAHILGRPFRGISVYFIAAAAGFAILRVWSSGAGTVLLRSAGNDPLSYESQAYSILATASLRGGESVFEYIPAYRYVKFLEHALFGDGNMLSAAVSLAAFFGGVFGLFRGMEAHGFPKLRRFLLAGLGCGLIMLGGYYVAGIIREGLSEYGTWILLLWALPGMYAAAAPGAILAGAVALSIAYTIRPNQITGILWIFLLTALGSWKKIGKAILLAGSLALGIALLPLVHNLYFGGQWVPAAVSGGMSVNLVLLPATWMAFLQGDPAAVAAVREQMGMLFLITDAPRSMWPTLGLMAAFGVCWVGVAAYSIARKKWSVLPWLATPVLFLAIHLVYGVSTYYPRHIVIGYLCMAVTSILVLSPGGPAVPSAEAGAVELPRT